MMLAPMLIFAAGLAASPVPADSRAELLAEAMARNRAAAGHLRAAAEKAQRLILLAPEIAEQLDAARKDAGKVREFTRPLAAAERVAQGALDWAAVLTGAGTGAGVLGLSYAAYRKFRTAKEIVADVVGGEEPPPAPPLPTRRAASSNGAHKTGTTVPATN